MVTHWNSKTNVVLNASVGRISDVAVLVGVLYTYLYDFREKPDGLRLLPSLRQEVVVQDRHKKHLSMQVSAHFGV